MAEKLKGKVAVVTGASKGIGASIALHFAAEGAAVVVNYSSSKEDADRVVRTIIDRGGKAVAVHANLAREADIRRLFVESDDAFGAIDILVNNAGVYEFVPLDNVTPGHFHRHFDLNVLGLILACQEAVRHFGPDGGSIVNISSGVSTVTPPNSVVYSATKAAVDAVTRVLSKELASRRIRVNSVNPGLVATEGARGAGLSEGAFRKYVESITPLGRIAELDEIAPAVVFLASSDAGYITGETLHITGGVH